VSTIVAGNSATNSLDVYGTLTSQGHNLIGTTNDVLGLVASDITNTNALLGPLQNNSGPTLTHPLLPGSPAIDAGTGVGAPSVDQRGFPRPSGNGVDIGACEFRSASQSILLTNGKVRIQFLFEPNQSYFIQASTNLPSWQTISTIPKDPSGQFFFEDPANLRQRFYRTLLSP
jgi:hypothetical protein